MSRAELASNSSWRNVTTPAAMLCCKAACGMTSSNVSTSGRADSVIARVRRFTLPIRHDRRHTKISATRVYVCAKKNV